jgi:3'-phosphoadenosine 5'-phosphosulfate sulfotransferase (PAPS reductase)/FAD synthetase/TusA-related sulfurtransferase
METLLLDTEDHKCPQVMILARRFLQENIESNNCRIVTREPSSLRDIPYYCNYESLDIIEKKEVNGEYHFLVRAKNVDSFDPSQESISVIDTLSEKNMRDEALFGMFSELVSDFKRLMNKGVTMSFQSSFGKDSMLMLTAALQAHKESMLNPKSPVNIDTPFIVIHIDTSVEVIPMTFYSHYVMTKLPEYCKTHNINLELHHKQPELHEQFTPLFAGARKLPSTPSLNSDCAAIWKVDNSTRIQRSLIKKYGLNNLISCIGSRNDEGAKRRDSLIKFGNADKTFDSLITKNDKGLQTFAPIIHWKTEDVFELLQRVGETPLIPVQKKHEILTFMPSHRLLIKLYGDSSNDVCEVNLSDQKAPKVCNGTSRNGCFFCFKAGRIDKAATAHNQHLRWSNIQGNATKVRDYIYSIAHDVGHRTLHPRTFDPVTNAVMLQPNILKSSTLEKILTYCAQLTFDDEIRAHKFRELVDSGLEIQDSGYAEIVNDKSMDDITRAEFMDMYKTGAQKHVIQLFTIKHALFLSAQWSMDGVRSVPFRPLAIWNNVFNKNKRIPFPSVDKTKPYKNDTIHDAVAFPLAEPGIDLLSQWVPPHRPWDIFESDRTEGCLTETTTNNLRATVTFSVLDDKETLKAKVNGRTIKLGRHTYKEALVKAQKAWKTRESGAETITITVFLTQRQMTSIGETVSGNPTKQKKIFNATRRSIKTDKQGNIVKGRTSLQMYKPNDTASLTNSVNSNFEVWVPSMVKKVVPYIAQHQTNLNVQEVNFKICDEALGYWLFTDGLEKVLGIHDRAIESLIKRRNKNSSRFSLRKYHGTVAFWELMQSGLISVNNSSWKTCQTTLQRTELFHEAGLMNFSNRLEEVIDHPKCLSMTEHRSMKANELLKIREARNTDRKKTKLSVAYLKSNPVEHTEFALKGRLMNLASIRNDMLGHDYLSKRLIVSMGVTGFDEINYVSQVRLADDWRSHYGTDLDSIDNFMAEHANTQERKIIQDNLLVKVKLNNVLFNINRDFLSSLIPSIAYWKTFTDKLLSFRYSSVDGELPCKKVRKEIRQITDDAIENIPQLTYMNEHFAGNFTGNNQSFTMFALDQGKTLSHDWHKPHWGRFNDTFNEIQDTIKRMQLIKYDNKIGKTTGKSRMEALRALQSAA